MNRMGIRVITLGLFVTLGLAATGCKSSDFTRPADGAPEGRPVDFDVPTAPQAADKAFPPRDRTPQVPQRETAHHGVRHPTRRGGYYVLELDVPK